MTIEIHSRDSIDRLIERGFPDHTAVISFYDPQTGQHEDTEPVDYTDLTDRLFQIESHGLTYEEYFSEAEELAEFVFAAIRDGYDIICQCEDGNARSAGCAAALHEFFAADGVFIFADYRYHPSQMVFHKVYNALWLCGRK